MNQFETSYVGKKCIVRGEKSGVFLGEITFLDTASKTVELKNVRRLWRWYGAETVEDLAKFGVSRPNDCRFPVLVGKKLIQDYCEITEATDESVNSLMEVKIWTAHK